MKGLLHSKRFRKNLRKWLFMYVGVMVLLATVVTYSKYVTSNSSNDKARTAKFDVKITRDESLGDDNCQIVYNEEDKKNKVTCDTGTFRPTSNLEYIFNVDTTKLEVTTDLSITVTTVFKENTDISNFKIESIENLNDPTEVITIGENEKTLKTFTKTINAANRGVAKYKVVIKYQNTSPNQYDYSLSDKDYEIVKVSYSAIQRNN